jgi:hypothetical protein
MRKAHNKITVEVVKERVKKAHGDLITIREDTYVCVSKPCVFIHKIHGEWLATPDNVSRGHGHKLDSIKKIVQKNTIPVQEIIVRLKKVHGDVVKLEEDTYISMRENCTFIHSVYGKWTAKPCKVIIGRTHPEASKEKYKTTMTDRYGVDNPNKNLELALRGARTNKQSTVKHHWETNEELICTASYECRVVDYLNKNQIGFEWQPKTFIMPNGRTYRPDLYLQDSQVWVEIKGWMRGDAQAKWDWFKSEHPTAELWNQKKLKEMGIL